MVNKLDQQWIDDQFNVLNPEQFDKRVVEPILMNWLDLMGDPDNGIRYWESFLYASKLHGFKVN